MYFHIRQGKRIIFRLTETIYNPYFRVWDSKTWQSRIRGNNRAQLCRSVIHDHKMNLRSSCRISAEIARIKRYRKKERSIFHTRCARIKRTTKSSSRKFIRLLLNAKTCAKVPYLIVMFKSITLPWDYTNKLHRFAFSKSNANLSTASRTIILPTLFYIHAAHEY